MSDNNASLEKTNLFKPITLGALELQNRVVYAPTTRLRNTKDNIATDIMIDYYDKRSQTPGSYIIFESALIGPEGGLVPYKPGVFTDRQCEALKKVTDVIHQNGCYVGVQVFAPGRTGSIPLHKELGLPLVAPTKGLFHNKQTETAFNESAGGSIEFVELTEAQIIQLQDKFVEACSNAITKAGFDIVELHATSGFLIEQFLSPLTNHRTDKYGGSVENRCRFLFELIDKLIYHKDVGPKRLSVRISPWSYHNMTYPEDMNPLDHPAVEYGKEIALHMEYLKYSGLELAYLSVIEPRVSGNSDRTLNVGESNVPIIKLWSGKLIRSGGYITNYRNKVDTVLAGDGEYAALKNDVNADDRTLIGILRAVTSNPDFIERLKSGKVLDNYQRKYFYTHQVEGYLTFDNYKKDGSVNTIDLSEDILNSTGVPLA